MMRILVLFLFLVLPFLLSAQSEYVVVDAIELAGNKRTKDHIVFREMDFGIGDSISIVDLQTRLDENELLILNSSLFTKVDINVKDWNEVTNHLTLAIEVSEAWYIYPFITFELADRNFNVWWVEQNRNFDRLNFGLRFYYVNLTGRRDLLKFVVQSGYTQKLELEYTLPSFNKAQTLGIHSNLFLSRNKEIGYTTLANKLEFDRFDDAFLLRRFRARLGLIYRPQQRHFHHTGLEFNEANIATIVAEEWNPDYFLNQKTKQQYLSFYYRYTFENRDIKPYPLNGNFFSIAIHKNGLGIFKDLNTANISASFAQYFSFNKRLSLETILSGQTALLRSEIPYYNNRALGFDETFIRGYEYYVIDGIDYILFKSSFRFNILNKEFNWGKTMPLKQFKRMPLKIYANLNGDLGYVADQIYQDQNPLSNTWLRGGGLGLDFVVYYDKVVQLEYSWNHLRENALFLHFKLSF